MEVKEYGLMCDTSFRENYCYTKFDESNWNSVMDDLNLKMSDCFDVHEFNEIPLSLFESIRGKALINYNDPIHKSYFLTASSIFTAQNDKNNKDKVLNKIIIERFSNLLIYYKKNLNCSELLKLIDIKLLEPAHPHVMNLHYSLLEWRQKIAAKKTKSYEFIMLCQDLAWHDLTIDSWMSDGKPKINCFSAKDILLLLINYYLKNVAQNSYLPGSVLFRLYESYEDSVDSSYIPSKKYKNSEWVDTYFIEYAFKGFYFQQLKKRKKMIVLTCDTGQETRMKTYLRVAKMIDLQLIKLGKKPQEYEPGYIVEINQNKHKVEKIIDIAKEMKKHESLRNIE